MTTAQIIEAAFERLTQFAFDPMPPIVWPGIASEPPNDGMWLEPELFPNEPINIAWDDESCVSTRGFFQILVHFRPGAATLEPTALADALCLHFPKGLDLGPVRVFKRAWQDAPVVESDDIYIPITIPYRGLT